MLFSRKILCCASGPKSASMGAGRLLCRHSRAHRLSDIFLWGIFSQPGQLKSSKARAVSISWDPWDNLTQMVTNLFPQERGCSGQCPRSGALSSKPCPYYNPVCDIGHVTSLLTGSDQMIIMVPSNSGILYVQTEHPRVFTFIFPDLLTVKEKRKQSHI